MTNDRMSDNITIFNNAFEKLCLLVLTNKTINTNPIANKYSLWPVNKNITIWANKTPNEIRYLFLTKLNAKKKGFTTIACQGTK